MKLCDTSNALEITLLIRLGKMQPQTRSMKHSSQSVGLYPGGKATEKQIIKLEEHWGEKKENHKHKSTTNISVAFKEACE